MTGENIIILVVLGVFGMKSASCFRRKSIVFLPHPHPLKKYRFVVKTNTRKYKTENHQKKIFSKTLTL